MQSADLGGKVGKEFENAQPQEEKIGVIPREVPVSVGRPEDRTQRQAYAAGEAWTRGQGATIDQQSTAYDTRQMFPDRLDSISKDKDRMKENEKAVDRVIRERNEPEFRAHAGEERDMAEVQREAQARAKAFERRGEAAFPRGLERVEKFPELEKEKHPTAHVRDAPINYETGYMEDMGEIPKTRGG